MMRVGFDLDGTLDKPCLAALAVELMKAGHEVHVITGVFPEAKDWQDAQAKRRKLARIGVPYKETSDGLTLLYGEDGYHAQLHILYAVTSTYDRDYRLIDLGLRKGALCEELGIEMFFDDSERYCEMIPKMSGSTTVLHVR